MFWSDLISTVSSVLSTIFLTTSGETTVLKAAVPDPVSVGENGSKKPDVQPLGLGLRAGGGGEGGATKSTTVGKRRSESFASHNNTSIPSAPPLPANISHSASIESSSLTIPKPVEIIAGQHSDQTPNSLPSAKRANHSNSPETQEASSPFSQFNFPSGSGEDHTSSASPKAHSAGDPGGHPQFRKNEDEKPPILSPEQTERAVADQSRDVDFQLLKQRLSEMDKKALLSREEREKGLQINEHVAVNEEAPVLSPEQKEGIFLSQSEYDGLQRSNQNALEENKQTEFNEYDFPPEGGGPPPPPEGGPPPPPEGGPPPPGNNPPKGSSSLIEIGVPSDALASGMNSVLKQLMSLAASKKKALASSLGSTEAEAEMEAKILKNKIATSPADKASAKAERTQAEQITDLIEAKKKTIEELKKGIERLEKDIEAYKKTEQEAAEAVQKLPKGKARDEADKKQQDASKKLRELPKQHKDQKEKLRREEMFLKTLEDTKARNARLVAQRKEKDQAKGDVPAAFLPKKIFTLEDLKYGKKICILLSEKTRNNLLNNSKHVKMLADLTEDQASNIERVLQQQEPIDRSQVLNKIFKSIEDGKDILSELDSSPLASSSRKRRDVDLILGSSLDRHKGAIKNAASANPKLIAAISAIGTISPGIEEEIEKKKKEFHEIFEKSKESIVKFQDDLNNLNAEKSLLSVPPGDSKIEELNKKIKSTNQNIDLEREKSRKIFTEQKKLTMAHANVLAEKAKNTTQRVGLDVKKVEINIKNLQKDLQDAESRLVKAKKIELDREELKRLEEAKKKISKTDSEKNKKLQVINSDIRGLKQKLKDTNPSDKPSDYEKRVETLKAEIKNAQSSHKYHIQTVLKTIEAEREGIEKEVKSLRGTLQDLNTQLDKESDVKLKDSLKNQIREITFQITEEEKTFGNLEIVEANLIVAKAEMELKNKIKEKENLEEDRQKTSNDLLGFEEKERKLVEKIDLRQQEHDKIKNDLFKKREIKKDIDALVGEKIKVQAKVKSLKSNLVDIESKLGNIPTKKITLETNLQKAKLEVRRLEDIVKHNKYKVLGISEVAPPFDEIMRTLNSNITGKEFFENEGMGGRRVNTSSPVLSSEVLEFLKRLKAKVAKKVEEWYPDDKEDEKKQNIVELRNKKVDKAKLKGQLPEDTPDLEDDFWVKL